ncbi:MULTISPECIES: ferredoxin [Mycolicibacterium]|uniref:ferredoxin n=1 Tax=Mycolicibacterium TaxID=1866885 RepID=UPI00090071B0|nr:MULTISPECIES: ferredoxin [Mycolicibacterium]
MTPNEEAVDGREYQLAIDADLCQGHGRCLEILPDRIDADDLGYPVVTNGAAGLDGQELARIHSAVDNCPEGAVSLRPKV